MRETDHHLEDRSSILWWRLGTQLSLIIVAAALLLSRPSLVTAIRSNKYPAEWLLVGPSIFLLLFIANQTIEYFTRRKLALAALDYIQIAFGFAIIALCFPSSFREYQARQIPDPTSLSLVEKFAANKDASIRALAILAASRHNLHNPDVGALIHKGLLDKDPLVQQAAKLVIEDNFGIRLRNGAEGIHQAKTFIKDVGSSASLIRKGSP